MALTKEHRCVKLRTFSVRLLSVKALILLQTYPCYLCLWGVPVLWPLTSITTHFRPVKHRRYKSFLSYILRMAVPVGLLQILTTIGHPPSGLKPMGPTTYVLSLSLFEWAPINLPGRSFKVPHRLPVPVPLATRCTSPRVGKDITLTIGGALEPSNARIVYPLDGDTTQ